MKYHEKYFGELKRKMKAMEYHMPETVAGLEKLFRNKEASGALPLKTKELIALSLAVHAGNSDCALMQLRAVIEVSASDQEVREAVEVAVMMGGMPALVTGSEVLSVMPSLRSKESPELLYDSLAEESV